MNGFRFGIGTHESPETLPDHLYRLHRKQMAAARLERERRITDDDVDETGRAWRGLVTPADQPSDKEPSST